MEASCGKNIARRVATITFKRTMGFPIMSMQYRLSLESKVITRELSMASTSSRGEVQQAQNFSCNTETWPRWLARASTYVVQPPRARSRGRRLPLSSNFSQKWRSPSTQPTVTSNQAMHFSASWPLDGRRIRAQQAIVGVPTRDDRSHPKRVDRSLPLSQC